MTVPDPARRPTGVKRLLHRRRRPRPVVTPAPPRGRIGVCAVDPWGWHWIPPTALHGLLARVQGPGGGRRPVPVVGVDGRVLTLWLGAGRLGDPIADADVIETMGAFDTVGELRRFTAEARAEDRAALALELDRAPRIPTERVRR